MNRKLAILFGVGLIGLGCLSADLRAAETANPKVRQLSQIFGDQSASKKALALVRDKRANVDDRRNALRALVNPLVTKLAIRIFPVTVWDASDHLHRWPCRELRQHPVQTVR